MDSSESKFTSVVRQKLNDGEDITASDILKAFIFGSMDASRNLKDYKKKFKKFNRGFKKSIVIDKFLGEKRIDNVTYSVDCCNKLYTECLYNYWLLNDYI